MAKKEVIIIQGQRIGRFKASWMLFKETFRFLRADKEMLWIPLIMGAVNFFLLGVLVAVFVTIVIGADVPLSDEDSSSSLFELLFIFSCYVVGAFTLALSQAAIVHTVYARAHGGDAKLSESLKVAWSHAGSLFLWSLITSTVGIVLRIILERTKLFGAIIVLLIGVSWSVLTYFVVPAMIIDKKSAFGSISKSGQVFKETWGETFVSNFGLGLTFFIIIILMLLSFVGLSIVSIGMGMELVIIPLLVVYFILFAALRLMQSVMEGVLKTLLYIYGSEGSVPSNFNQELLEGMMVRKAVPQQASIQESDMQASVQ